MLRIAPFHCPACGSDQIEGDIPEVYTFDSDNNQYAKQNCSCLECETEWTDTYHLKDIQITKVPEKI